MRSGKLEVKMVSELDKRIAKVSKKLMKLEERYGTYCLKEAIKLMQYDVNVATSEGGEK